MLAAQKGLFGNWEAYLVPHVITLKAELLCEVVKDVFDLPNSDRKALVSRPEGRRHRFVN